MFLIPIGKGTKFCIIARKVFGTNILENFVYSCK